VGAGGVPGAVIVGLTGLEEPDPLDVPVALVAVAEKVYARPLVRPVTVHEVAGLVTVQVRLPGNAVTVYDAGAPPVPAATVTVADPSPATAVGTSGVPGASIGLTLFDAADPLEVPAAFVAVAENVYGVPLVRPVTVHEVAGLVTVQVLLSGVEVTVYEAGAPPPTPAATVTVAEPSPPTAVGVSGVPGAAIGLTEPDAADPLEVPAAFVAVAENVYGVPVVRPVTVHEVAGLVTVQVLLPGVEVTVYVAGAPPVPESVTVTVAEVAPATAAVGVSGVPGASIGLTLFDAADPLEVPAAFVAVAEKVYGVPLVRPVTVHDVAGLVTVQVRPSGVEVTV